MMEMMIYKKRSLGRLNFPSMSTLRLTHRQRPSSAFLNVLRENIPQVCRSLRLMKNSSHTLRNSLETSGKSVATLVIQMMKVLPARLLTVPQSDQRDLRDLNAPLVKHALNVNHAPNVKILVLSVPIDLSVMNVLSVMDVLNVMIAQSVMIALSVMIAPNVMIPDLSVLNVLSVMNVLNVMIAPSVMIALNFKLVLNVRLGAKHVLLVLSVLNTSLIVLLVLNVTNLNLTCPCVKPALSAPHVIHALKSCQRYLSALSVLQESLVST